MQLVQLRVPPVLPVDLQLDDVLVVHQRLVPFRRLVLQDLLLVLHYLDPLLQLRQVLRRVLDQVHVLIPRALHLLVQRLEAVQLELSFLLYKCF